MLHDAVEPLACALACHGELRADHTPRQSGAMCVGHPSASTQNTDHGGSSSGQIRLPCSVLPRSVEVPTVLDAKHGDHGLVVVNLVDHAIGATPCRPETGEFSLQRMAEASRVLAQWAEHELDHRCRDTLR